METKFLTFGDDRARIDAIRWALERDFLDFVGSWVIAVLSLRTTTPNPSHADKALFKLRSDPTWIPDSLSFHMLAQASGVSRSTIFRFKRQQDSRGRAITGQPRKLRPDAACALYRVVKGRKLPEDIQVGLRRWELSRVAAKIAGKLSEDEAERVSIPVSDALHDDFKRACDWLGAGEGPALRGIARAFAKGSSIV